MDEQKDPRPSEILQAQWREAMESDWFGTEYGIWFSGWKRAANIAALSQPAAAQGDSSHSAGGECGGLQGHESAPWWVAESGVRNAGGYIAFSVHTSHWPRQDERYAKEVLERKANMQLIAAAPELLEALQWLVDILPDPELDNDELQRTWTKKGRAAIAKATP